MKQKKISIDKMLFGAIIEFSNRCRRNCAYCGLNTSIKGRNHYDMTQEQAFELIKFAKDEGYDMLVLQSGEYSSDPDWIFDAIYYAYNLGLKPIVSTGEKKGRDYIGYRQACAHGVLLRIETTNQELYARHHPGYDVKSRIEATHYVKEVGLKLISGPLIGLPGMTEEILAEDMQWLKEIGVDYLSIGTFKPTSGTLLENEPAGDPLQALKWQEKAMEMIKPQGIIPATSLGLENRLKSLELGGNIWLTSITPANFSKDYDVFSGKHKQDILSLTEIKKTIVNY